MKPATRLITLILLLQREPNQKAADLAEKLGVSVRTLHRYFNTLDQMGIPVYTERGPHGGFSLVRGYKMPPLIFSPEEAAALYLGAGLVEEIWASLYREAARGALAKLDNVLPDDQRQEVAWARRSLVATGLRRPDPDQVSPHLENLSRAVRELRTVSMIYTSNHGGESGWRDLDPYALVHRWGWWYVIGYCHVRRGVRSFRLDRIREFTGTERAFQIHPGFDIHDYLASEFRDQPKVQVRMRFVPQGAQIARANRGYWETLEEQPDGSVMVTLSAPDLEWAASSALAYGPLVTVLEPAELRRIVRDWALEAARLYPAE